MKININSLIFMKIIKTLVIIIKQMIMLSRMSNQLIKFNKIICMKMIIYKKLLKKQNKNN